MRGWVGFSKGAFHREDALAGSHTGCPGRGVVPGRRGPAITLLLISIVVVGLGVGCAARRSASVPSSVPLVLAPGQAATPTVSGTAPSGSNKNVFPPLPGTNRVYPSQDPRNHATQDAPEAFPLAGAVIGSAVKGAVAEAVDGDPAAGSVAEDAMADTLAGDPAAELAAEDAMTDSPDRDPVAGPVAEDVAAEGSVAASLPPSATWSVQLLASSSLSVARARARGLTRYFSEPPRVEPVGGLFKVRVGHCATRGEAEALRRRAFKLGLRDAFVVRPEAGGEPPQ